MSPTMRTAAEIFTIPTGHVTLTVDANGGSVVVEMLHDRATNAWVQVVAPITADSLTPLSPGPGAQLRITPSGGATYTVHGMP